jgi:Core-2/I-Branching enzyme
MKIAYLIFAYKNPNLIKKTIEFLTDDDCAFFVHIDSKSDIRQFESLRGNNVFFIDERIAVYWGEFSGVEAILLLIRQALAAFQRYDYFVLLSGSEYPLRSRQYIRRFFDENRGQEYMTMKKMPAPGKPLSRINTLRFPSYRPLLRFVFRVLAKVRLAQRDYRKHFGTLEPYSGHTWWALTRDACAYIVDFKRHDQVLTKFFQNTFAPEETFFHTILGNSPFKSRMRRNLVYEDWSVGGGHPAMINEEHCAVFESQEKVCVQDLHGPGELLFARKFSDENLQLVKRIDAMISCKEAP